ncbi:MltR family transcriptional regulator [Vibrio chagasii]|nr:MltR family transcriptional regulator [Vibrio chagasii]
MPSPSTQEDGPLVEIDVVSKLMFAMGKISLRVTQILTLFDQMHGFVAQQQSQFRLVMMSFTTSSLINDALERRQHLS